MIRRVAVTVLALLALSVDGWGCGGEAAPFCSDEERGWTCNEDCSDCYCDGAVEPDPDNRGDCLERTSP